MHALQALVPSALFAKPDALMEPDSHGGYEMGTWDFGCYIALLRKALREDKAWQSGSASVEERVGHVSKLHTFTADECGRIAAYLDALPVEHPKGAHGKDATEGGVFYGNVLGLAEHPKWVKAKWHRHLVALFTAGDVVWIAA